MAFDPSKFGAVPVKSAGGFDPSKFGATPVPVAPKTGDQKVADMTGAIVGDVKKAGSYVFDIAKKAVGGLATPDNPGSGFTQNVQDTKQAVQEAAAQPTLAKKVLGAGKAVERGILGPLTTAAEAVFTPVGDAVKYISDHASNLPSVQRFAMSDAVGNILHKTNDVSKSLDEVLKSNPDLAPDIKNVTNLLLLIGGQKGAAPAAKIAADVTKVASKGVEAIAQPIIEGTGAAATKAADVTAKAFDSATGALKAPFKGSFKPEVQAAFDRQGVEAPVSAVTSSKAVQGLEAGSQGSFFGAKVTASIENARQSIFNITESLRKNVNPDKLITPGVSAEAAGHVLQDAVTKVREVFNEVKGKLYDDAAAKIGKQQADLTQTRQALQDIISQKEASADPSARAQADYYKQLDANLSTASTRDFNTIKQTRTDIGKKLKNRTDPVTTGDQANLKRIYGALSDDLDATVSLSGPEGAQALKAANDYYKAGITRINSFVGRTIFNAKSPELIVGKLVKAGDVSTVRELKTMVGEEAFHTVAASFMNKIIADVIVPLTGKLSPSKISSIIAKYGDDFLREVVGERGLQELKDLRRSAIVEDILDRGTKDGKVQPSALAHAIESYDQKVLSDAFSPEELAKLKDVQTMSAGLSKGTKMADGSPTAEKILNSPTFGAILAVKALPVLIAKFAADWGISKLVGTKIGKRYLTSGLRRNEGPYAKMPATATDGQIPSPKDTNKSMSTAKRNSMDSMSGNVPQGGKPVKGGAGVYRYTEKTSTPAPPVAKPSKKGSKKL